jgi:hypothetical protein
MGWYTPIGSDQLVWRPDTDPTEGRRRSTPEELDAALPGARALAAGVSLDSTDHDRETVQRMTDQMVKGGVPLEQARQTAITAARRHNTGEPIPYTTTSTAARRGHGGA